DAPEELSLPGRTGWLGARAALGGRCIGPAHVTAPRADGPAQRRSGLVRLDVSRSAPETGNMPCLRPWTRSLHIWGDVMEVEGLRRGCYSIRPRRIAIATACALVVAPSRLRRPWMWDLTVALERPR